MHLNIPANTSYIEVGGTLSPWGRFWTAEFDPLPPLAREGDLSYGGDAPFEIPATLFAAPLDPTVRYNASIVVGDDPVAARLGVSYLLAWSGL